MPKIFLRPMTPSMYHEFFKEYENDLDLYLDKEKYVEYVYGEENVEKYIQKQFDLKRISLAVVSDDEIIGEILIKNIQDNSATIGITMKNSKCKGKGYGTVAEKLVVEYIFNQLNIATVYADTVVTNTRSQHVLEKVGFKRIRSDDEFIYYKIEKQN